MDKPRQRSRSPAAVSGQQRNTFIDRSDRIDGKAAGGTGLDDVLAQHQMLDIRLRDQDALRPRQAALLANIEEALDLLVDPADRLNLAMLVHRSGHRQILPQRHVRQRREEGVEFGGRRAVALDAAIGLLEHQAREQRHRGIERVSAGQKAGQDQDALGVQRPAEFDFALDVDDFSAAGSHLAGDAGRPPKGKSAELGDAEAVDLADMRSHRVDQRYLFEDRFLRPIAQPCRAPDARQQGAIHIGTGDNAAFCFTGAKIRLDQDLAQLFHDQRKLAGMIRRARRMFEHEGDCFAIQRV